MRRRDFIIGAGGALLTPAFARAQSPLPVVGWLGAASAASYAHWTEPFRAGLAEAGFSDGRNVRIDYRWADGNFQKLPAMADELVAQKVAVLFTAGSTASAFAAKSATSSIPVVFTVAIDPLESGLVTSLSRPAGNVTGISFFASPLGPKRLELLGEIVPAPARIGVLLNQSNVVRRTDIQRFHEAANLLKRDLVIFEASTVAEIDAAFARSAQAGVGALLVSSDAFFAGVDRDIVDIAARHAMPAAYPVRNYATVGGLLSYGDKRAAGIRDAGRYVGRILSGMKPSDLPVMQPTLFELVLNLKTAKALGLDIPESFLVRADEVIE